MPDYLAGILIGVALGAAILFIARLGIARPRYDKRSVDMRYMAGITLLAHSPTRTRRRM